MIPVELYSKAYYFLLSAVVLLSILPLFFKQTLDQFPKINLLTGTFLILLICIGFIGLREPYASSIFLGDTITYTRTFEKIDEVSVYDLKDLGFYAMMKFFAQFASVNVFYFFCAFLYVIPTFYTFKKWFGKYAFFALVSYVVSMSFWSFGINGLRNGIGVSFFIFALNFNKQKKIQILLMLIAISMHKSMILPFIAYFIASYYTDTKTYIKIWLFVAVLSFFIGRQFEGVITDILISVGLNDDQRVSNMFESEIEGNLVERRYRIDFVIYSAIPIMLGYYYIYKKNFNDKLYEHLLNFYLIANTAWLVVIYGAFTNRTAFLSWFIMPILLCYPILKDKYLVPKQNLFLGIVLFFSLLFTLAIEFK